MAMDSNFCPVKIAPGAYCLCIIIALCITIGGIMLHCGIIVRFFCTMHASMVFIELLC